VEVKQTQQQAPSEELNTVKQHLQEAKLPSSVVYEYILTVSFILAVAYIAYLVLLAYEYYQNEGNKNGRSG
jgi:Trk-type K+ transport system membrane component